MIKASSGSGTGGTDFYYGSATRTVAGNALVQEQDRTVNGGSAGNFVSRDLGGTPGFANDGTVAFSQTGRINNVAPTLSSIWTQTGGTASNVVVEQNAISAGQLAGNFYGHGTANTPLQGLQIARTGGDAYFVGTYSASAGGSQAGVAIFKGNTGAVVLKTGDAVGAETVSNDAGAISTSAYGFSGSASRYVTVADVIAGTASNDLVLVTGTTGGTPTVAATTVREGSLIGGGNGTETWSSFSRAAINDSGSYIVAGSSTFTTPPGTGSDWVVAVNGTVAVRDGSVLTVEGGGTVTLDATSNPEVALNNSDDYAALFTGNLIVNGTVVARIGTAVDTNNDGIDDTTLTFVNASGGLAMSERIGGLVDVYFLGRVNNSGDDTLLRYTVAVPEPTAVASAVAGLSFLLRRRRTA